MKSTFSLPARTISCLVGAALVSCGAGLVACTAGRSLPATAGPTAVDVPTKVVRYGDLDLESTRGAHVLYLRLLSASREVCVPYESIDRNRQAAWRTCVDTALDSAVAKINKPLVSALHEQSVGRSGAGKS